MIATEMIATEMIATEMIATEIIVIGQIATGIIANEQIGVWDDYSGGNIASEERLVATVMVATGIIHKVGFSKVHGIVKILIIYFRLNLSA